MSEVAELTVEAIGKKPEKKNGYLKSGETWYVVPPEMVKDFTKGESCKVEWKAFGDSGRSIVKKLGVPANPIPKQNVRQRMDPSDARGAFITVILQAYVSAGKISLNADAISTARHEIGRGYDMSHNPQRADDLNDEIPY